MRFSTFWRVPIQLCAYLLLSISVFAQIPNGYYNSAEGKTGAALKTALYNIIKGHTDLGYGGLYTTYQTSDNIKINGQNRVYDMYSIKADGTANYYFSHSSGDQCGNYSVEGDCYNREHTMPQSWFNEASPMRNDAHHVIPTDGKVNGMRSSFPHAEVGTASYTSSNGSKKGNCSSPGYSGIVFEPIDEFKGDFARMYMYMATRYEDKIASWVGNGTASTVLAGNSYPVYKSWYVTLLLKWHEQDPVSTKELERNEAIYDRQHNRNPFIDNPDYAEMIWGSTPANPLSFTSTAITSATIGFEYTYSIVAHSTTSGATLSITAPTKPSWLTFSATGNGTATLSGTPVVAGSNSVVLQVSDGTNTKMQSFTITVQEPVSTVNFSSIPVTDATVATQYTYNVHVSSSTSTPATITAQVKPAWLTLTANGSGAATLSGTPTADNIGSNSVTLKASNGTDNVEQMFTIIVEDSTGSAGGEMFTETFENMPASSSSYANFSWTGDNDIHWTATNARTDQTLDNRAICLKNSASALVQSETLEGGCKLVGLQCQQEFSGSGGVLTVYVNSTSVGTIDVTEDTKIDSFVVSASGDFVIKVESNGAARIKIDNLFWRHKGGSTPQNQTPVITNIVANPMVPKVNQPITISATITDADGTIASAQLLWGTTQSTLSNTLNMSANGSTYSATIPAQSEAGTIYYRISAKDNLNANSVMNGSIEIVALNVPIISNVAINPQNPTSSESVTVSATVTDEDDDVDEVELLWGVSEDNLSESITMTNNGTSYSATIAAQPVGTTVWYKVQATDSESNQSTTSPMSFEVVASNSSPVITNVSHSPESPTQNNSVTISADVTDADNNLSEVSLMWGLAENAMNNNILMEVYAGSTYRAEIPAQATNTTVYYKVQATDSESSQTTTNIMSFDVVVANSSPVITNISHSPESPTQNNSVTVSADVTDADGNLYEVNLMWGLAENALSNVILMEVYGSSTNKAVIPAQAANSTVYYKIVAVDAANATTESSICSYSVSFYNSIINNTISEVKLYPNPAKSSIIVECVSSEVTGIDIFNTSGLCVYSENRKSGKVLIDISSFKPSLYLVKVQTNEGVRIFRVVKE